MQNDYAQWDNCYGTNWIARAIIDEWTPADAVWVALYPIRTVQRISRHRDALDLTQVTEEAIAWSRLYGGAGVVMITNQDLESRLT